MFTMSFAVWLLLICAHVHAAFEIETHADFLALLENSQGRPVIVDYYSDTCVPCQRIMPFFQRLSEEFADNAVFAKVNVMRNQETPVKTGIRSMPTFQFYVNGQIVHSFSKADEVELRVWTDKLAHQASATQAKGLTQAKSLPRKSQSVPLTSFSSDAIQEELDKRLVLKQQQEEKEWAQNPCLTNRKRSHGRLTEKVVIIGSGPGGAAAAIYAARANLCPLVIAPSAGGQLLAKGVDIENYPGLPSASGADMIEVMRRQARSFAAEFKEDSVIKVDATVRPFEISTENGGVIKAHSVIVATGAEARWLGAEGEYEYRGHGVSGCATCDGFLFKGSECAVIGGGDTAMEEALVLARVCSGVTIFHRRDTFRASQAMQQQVFNNPKIAVRFNTVVTRFGGVEERLGKRSVKKLTHLELQDTTNPAKTSRFDVSAAFVAIGHTPNTKFLKEQVEMDGEGYLILEAGRTRTSVDGIFAAGDVADHVYQQAVTSCGSGAMAALDAEKYLIENPAGESCASYDSIGSWNMKDLHSEVHSKGLACEGCYKKSDYIEMLQMSC